jgi:rubrerythrin
MEKENRYDFTADKIFEIAIRIERNGARFYREAAERVSDPALCELLLDLARMEEVHGKRFASFRSEITEEEKASPRSTRKATEWDT